jgi:hypothetical protein
MRFTPISLNGAYQVDLDRREDDRGFFARARCENVFIPANDGDRERKIHVLMDCFASEHNKRWFTPETFNGLMRLRGVEYNALSGYVEAFYCRKIMLAS